MKKRKIKKLGINKSVVCQLTQLQIMGGQTHCCPTNVHTCANTCPAGCGITEECGSGSELSRNCPFHQVPN